MSAIDLFLELMCTGRNQSDVTNIKTHREFRFDEVYATPDDEGNTVEYEGVNKDIFDYHSLCNNNTDWNRDLLMGNDVFRKIMDNLNVYLTPVLILLGIVGNMISFLVFTTTYLRRQSSSVYLASLAVVDMLFLSCLCVIWLSWIRVNVFHRHIWCQCVVYLSYVCTFLSVWYVVSFTIERYIIVHYPLRKDRYCTRARAKKVVMLLAVLAVIIYSFSAVTNGSISFETVPVCTPLTRYYTIITIATALDFVCSLVLPSLVIVILNIKIAIRIMQYSKPRMDFNASNTFRSNSSQPGVSDRGVNNKSREKRVISGGMPHELHSLNSFKDSLTVVKHEPRPRTISGISSPRQDSQQCSALDRLAAANVQRLRVAQNKTGAQFRTARMLIIVSSVFVILHSPNHIFRVYAFFQSSVDERYMTGLMALKWHELVQLLYHLSFSINVCLYSACGRQFRLALKGLCVRFVHKFNYIRAQLINLRCCVLDTHPGSPHTERDMPEAPPRPDSEKCKR